MKLTKAERMSLMNQFLILAKLYPDEAREYENRAKVLQMGYSKHYDALMHMEDREMDEDRCSVILEMLDMFTAIRNSGEKLAKLPEHDREALKFIGFDANEEPDDYAYARYLIQDEGRYPWLRQECPDPDLNSHIPVFERYKRMLIKWLDLKEPSPMRADELTEVRRAGLATD